MLGLSDFDIAAAAVFATRLEQSGRLVSASAVVTLVAARAVRAAKWADAFNEAIGQPFFAVGAVQLSCAVAIKIPVCQVRREEILRHRPVVFGVGLSEQIEADAQAAQRLRVAWMVTVHHRARGDALIRGGHCDRRAVGV